MNKTLILASLLTICAVFSRAQCQLDYSRYVPIFTETFDDIDSTSQLGPQWWQRHVADSVYGQWYGWGSEMWSPDHISFLQEDGKKFARLFSTRLQDTLQCSGCPAIANYTSTKKYVSGMLQLMAGEEPGIPGYTYGIFEASIRLPEDDGAWSAFWFVGAEHGGKRVEIDVIDNNSEVWKTAVHDWSLGNCGNGLLLEHKTPGIDLSKDFHLYSIAWTPQKITYFLDRKEVLTYSNPVLSTDCPGAPHLVYTYPEKVVLLLTLQMVPWTNTEGAHMDIGYVKIYKPCIEVNGACKPPAQLTASDYNTTPFIDCR